MSETALPAIGHPDEHPIGLVVTDDLRSFSNGITV